MFRIERVIAPVVCAALLLSGCGKKAQDGSILPDGTLSAHFTSSGEFPPPGDDGLILAARRGGYELYFEREGLTVQLRETVSGRVLTSAAEPDEGSSETWRNFVNSGLVIEYYKGSATTVNKLNLYSGSPEITVTPIENGFAAEINFATVGISLTELVTLTDSGLLVQIPNSSIHETKPDFRLAAVYVLPFLGYTHLGDTAGYMLIPDGCGALIALEDNNEKYSQPYKAKVYGGNYSVEENNAAVQKFEDQIATMSETQSVTAPVFGMVHTDEQIGFLGVIEQGKYNAEIYAYPNGVVTDYNWVTARYVYREVYLYPISQTGGVSTVQESRESFDIAVRYELVSGYDADYVGLAKAYRGYLTDAGVLGGSDPAPYSVRADFFAGDVEKALIGTSFVEMTRVFELEEILDSLLDGGVEKITAVYKGWQKNGVFGTLPRTPSFERGLGSLSDFSVLDDKYGGQVKLLLYADFLNTYEKSGSGDSIYRCNGRIFSDDTFLTLHPVKYRYTAPAACDLLERYARSLEDCGVGLAADGLSSECYSWAADGQKQMYSRQSFCNAAASALAVAGEKAAALYTPNDYLWSETADYFDFRLYGSDYKFVSEEVPFFAIALRGGITLHSEYVNFKADSTEYLLKMIESGVYPSFLLTMQAPSELLYTDSASVFSCEYAEYADMLIEYDKIFRELDDATRGAVIEDYRRQDGVSSVTYSNGTVVTVNFNSTDTQADGQPLAAQSYLVKAGGENG